MTFLIYLRLMLSVLTVPAACSHAPGKAISRKRRYQKVRVV
jgi:hypothetical protein